MNRCRFFRYWSLAFIIGGLMALLPSLPAVPNGKTLLAITLVALLVVLLDSPPEEPR